MGNTERSVEEGLKVEVEVRRFGEPRLRRATRSPALLFSFILFYAHLSHAPADADADAM